MSLSYYRPRNWSKEQVEHWACTVKLSEEVLIALQENEVDGETLLGMQIEEIQVDLRISSLPAQQHLWEMIEQLRKEEQNADVFAALDVYREEIHNLEAEFLVKPISYETEETEETDQAILVALEFDAELERQLLEDRLLCFKLQQAFSTGQQIFEDYHFAQTEQKRMIELAIQSDYDCAYVHSLSTQGQNQFTVNGRVKTLSYLCIQVCVRHHINVAEALTTSKIKSLMTSWSVVVSNFTSLNQDNNIDVDVDVSSPLEETSNKTSQKAVKKTQLTVQTKDDIINAMPILECNSCYEKKNCIVLQCPHPFCADCMYSLFRAALGDNTLIPLRCCETPIDESHFDLLLSVKDCEVLKERTEEKTAKNKMYCPTCNKFINLDKLPTTAQQLSMACDCGVLICTQCKTEAHHQFTCEQNIELRKVSDEPLLELARQKGWKQCPGCSFMIEFIYGCNHMVCTSCSFHFCFTCLRPWDQVNTRCSSGRCQLWDEERLVQAAEDRVAAEDNANPNVANLARVRQNNPYVREQRIQNAMRAIGQNEYCHHTWIRRNLRGSCENCGFVLFVYGMVCTGQCRSTVCYTCANHRLPRRGWR